MRVAKWGNSHAVRLPAGLVKALELKGGRFKALAVSREPGHQELLKRLHGFRSRLPSDQIRPGLGECRFLSMDISCHTWSAIKKKLATRTILREKAH